MVLIIHWSNAGVTFLDEFIQYFATSEVITLYLCANDLPHHTVNKNKHQAKNTVILLTETDVTPEKIKSISSCQFWDPRSRAVVLIVGLKVDSVEKFFSQIWNFTKAINVVVMLPVNTSVQFFTSYPYHNFKVKELIFDHNNSVSLFPNKIPNNFNGSVIYVGTTSSLPYVFDPKFENNFSEGFEIKMFETLAEHFNFRVMYRLSPKGENPWIVRSPDKKIVGLSGLLTRLEVDIVFHGIRIRDLRTNRCSHV